MAKCAIYCRVSTDEQAEKGNVQSQVEYAKKYLELHGPENNIDNFELYIDEGISGTIPLADRPAGSKLIADASSNSFTILYMYRLDRLARSVKHVLDTYELLESKGIALKSMTEAFDTSSPTGKFFMTLLASIAALERDTIRERTQMGKDRGARAGKWVSGLAPFGYRAGEDGKLNIYEQEAETVRMVFDLYNQDSTMVEIARYLNARGIDTPATSKGTRSATGGKWHPASISKILSADVYTGKHQYLQGSKGKRKNIEIDVPVIIGIEMFSDAQKKAKVNSNLYRGRKGRLYLLRGVIFCGHCGSAMSGSTANNNKHIYYRCPNTADLGQGKKCTARSIKAIDLENAIWTDILEIANHPERFQQYLDLTPDNSSKEKPLLNELSQVEEAIQTKQKARGKILSMITRGIVSDDEAESELQNLAIEIRSLNSRKEHLFQEEKGLKSKEEELISLQVALDTIKSKSHSLSIEEKFELIQSIVRRVEVLTIMEEGKKVRNGANVRFSLSNIVCSYDHLENKNTIQNLYELESTWEFQAFSRNGGVRIKWQ